MKLTIIIYVKTSTTDSSIPCIQETNYVHPLRENVPLERPDHLNIAPADIRIAFDREMSLLIYTSTLSWTFWIQYHKTIEEFLEQNGSLDLLTDSTNKCWAGTEAWRFILEYWLTTPHDQVSGVAYFKKDGIPVENYEYAQGVPVCKPKKRKLRNALARTLFETLIEKWKKKEIKGKLDQSK